MAKLVLKKKQVENDVNILPDDPKLERSVLIEAFKAMPEIRYPRIRGFWKDKAVFEGYLKYKLSASKFAKYKIMCFVPLTDSILNNTIFQKKDFNELDLLFYLSPSKAIPYTTFEFDRLTGPDEY
jgi:hypothetical protein